MSSPEPGRAGSGAGRRDAAPRGCEGEATDGVDRGLAEDHGRERIGRGWKKPRSLREPGAKPRQDCSVVPRSSAPTGELCFSQEKEDGIRPGVGVEGAGSDQRVDETGSNSALGDQIALNSAEHGGVARWK